MVSRRPVGAHSLGLTGLLNGDNIDHLSHAARTATNTGCDLFEIACNPITDLPGATIAQALKDGGINNAAFCQFFPTAPDGTFPLGNPLGDPDEIRAAKATLTENLQLIGVIQQGGVAVEHVTGPWAFPLGHMVSNSRDGIRDGIVSFCQWAGDQFEKYGVTGSLEYLRPGEDEGSIAGIDELLLLLGRINHRRVRAHLDTYHMVMRGEVPHEVILKAAELIGYFHANGSDDRLPPGAFQLDGDATATDTINWHLNACALRSVKYSGPVTAEPFCKAIQDAIPALKMRRAPIEPERFYKMTNKHLEREGMFTAA